MANDLDVDVVFAHSALHQHLEDVGFEEMELEHHASRGDGIQGVTATAELVAGEERLCSWFPSLLTNLQQWWKQDARQVEYYHGLSFGNEVLQAGVLEKEDSHFLHNYIELLSTEPSHHHDWIHSRTAWMVVVCVSGVLCAYGAHRWLGFTLLHIGIFPVWLYDLAMVTLGLVTLLPFLSCLILRMVHKLFMFSSVRRLKELLHEVAKYQNDCRKAMRLVQETELVARGFTFVSSDTPVSRLEQSSPRFSERQCPELRHLLFHLCRDVMLTTRSTMQGLVARCPLLGPTRENNYLAQISLEEYGPCLTLEDEDELRKVTDNYSIAAQKAIFHVSCLHQSELLRWFVVGSLLQSENNSQSALSESRKVVHVLVSTLKSCLQCLSVMYEVHQCAMLDPLDEPEDIPAAKVHSRVTSLYTAVHSLDLHLQAALRRVRKLEQHLEPLCGSLDPLSAESTTELTFGLNVIRSDLNSCRDCWEESLARLEKGTKPVSRAHCKSSGSSDVQEDANPLNEPITIFDLGDPIIQDQVFEAYTDPTEVDPTDWDMEPLVSEEERVKRHHEKQEAVRLLKELKSVIAVRGQQWEEREKQARLRMQPGPAEDASDSSTSPAESSVTASSKEIEGDETRLSTSANSDIDIEEICESIISPSVDPYDHTRTLLRINKGNCTSNDSNLKTKTLSDTCKHESDNPSSPTKSKPKCLGQPPEKDYGFFLDDSDMSPEGELISRYDIQAAFGKRSLDDQQTAANGCTPTYSLDDCRNDNMDRYPDTTPQADTTSAKSQDNISNSIEHSMGNLQNVSPEHLDNNDGSAVKPVSCSVTKKCHKDDESTTHEATSSVPTDNLVALKGHKDDESTTHEATSRFPPDHLAALKGHKDDEGTTHKAMSRVPTDHLAALKERLAQHASHSVGVSQSSIAALAALKSQSFGFREEEVFGESKSEDEDDDGDNGDEDDDDNEVIAGKGNFLDCS